MVKVTRGIEATAWVGSMNPLTSHSQEMGGVVWGIGAALHKATEIDHRFGRIMNASLQDYHVARTQTCTTFRRCSSRRTTRS